MVGIDKCVGGMQKQQDSNIAADMGKEAKSIIVTHGTIRVKIIK